MAKENIQKFYEQLSKSKELQEKILKAQEKCSGDEGRDVILKETVLPLAKETGLEFTEEELKEYERSKITEKGISEEELENVSGGWSGCVFIGCSDSTGIACVALGVNGPKSDDIVGVGVHVCYYLGVGIGGSLD